MTEEIKVVESECRFVVHIPSHDGIPDYHLVKLKNHYSDGTSKPAIKFIKDFKRPFWVTKTNYRTYQQKKETEDLDRVEKFECTQSELRNSVAKALGVPFSNDQIKKLSNSPYLYGSEITSSAIIKKIYNDKNKKYLTPYSVMCFDIETDMLNRTDDPIIMTAVMGKELFIAVTKDFIKGISNSEALFRDKLRIYVSEFVDLTDYHLNYVESDDCVEMIKTTFQWIHSQMPDFLSIWNMDFDIPRILSTLKKYDVNPIHVFCPDSIPEPLRFCKYKEGLKKRRKSNGQEFPIDYADQWHSLLVTSGFYVIDAMCSYRLLRLSEPKEISYSLDAVLNKELGVRKLKFKEAEGYVKDRWHIFMQSNYKIEYMVYALFDSLSMKLLDDKIGDINFKLPGYAGITPFSKCNSKPKMIADALHFYCLENNQVINSIGEQLNNDLPLLTNDEETIDETDPEVLSLKDWIVTLPAHLVVPGLSLLEEDENMATMMRAFIYDSDCVGAYPNAGSILNISKSTTKREIIGIEGIDETLFRRQNINLCTGYINSLEYSERMLGFPNLFELENFDIS